jgi:hypothetical protein
VSAHELLVADFVPLCQEHVTNVAVRLQRPWAAAEKLGLEDTDIEVKANRVPRCVDE